MIQEAVPPAAVADEEQSCQEDQGTNRARLPFQEETQQVEAHEHGVAEPQRWVEGLGYEQDGQQPLQAVHGGCWLGPGGSSNQMGSRTGSSSSSGELCREG